MTAQHTPHTQSATWIDRLPGARAFKNLDIGPKLTVGFGILMVMILLSAGLSYVGSRVATRQINRTTEIRAPAALAASQAQANLLQMRADVRGYLALGESGYREGYFQSAAAFKANLDELDKYRLGLDVENQYRLAVLQIRYEEWAALPEQLFELRDDQLDREPAYALLAIDGVRYAGQVLIATNTLIELQGQREVSQENLEQLADMAKFQGNFAAMLSALRSYVTTYNRIYRGEFEVNLQDNGYVWERLYEQRASYTESQQEQLDIIAENRDAFLELPDQIFAILEGERWREDLYLFKEKALPLTREMQDLLNEITEEQQAALESELNSGRDRLNTTNLVILGSGVLALLIGVGMAYVTRDVIAGPVIRLTHVAERIRGGDLDARAWVESRDEVGILAETFNNMTAKLRSTLIQVRKEKKRADDLLEVVIPIGVQLSTERDFNRLLENMLLEAKDFCHADAGTLYLVDTEAEELRFVIVRNDSQGLALGGTTGNKITYDPLPLEQAGAQGHSAIATQVALSGKPNNTPDHNRPSDIIDTYMVQSLLTIPLKNSQDEVLGVLQLINAKDPATGDVVAFDQNLQQMMSSFSSLAVAALEAYIREEALREQIEELRLEIDHSKRERQVAEITATDYFQDLKKRARKLRKRNE